MTENFSSIYKIVRDAKLLQLHLDLMTQKYCRVFVAAVIIYSLVSTMLVIIRLGALSKLFRMIYRR